MGIKAKIIEKTKAGNPEQKFFSSRRLQTIYNSTFINHNFPCDYFKLSSFSFFSLFSSTIMLSQ